MMDNDMLSTSLPREKKMFAGSYSWKINNFFGEWRYVDSPVFSVGPQNNVKIKLLMWKVKMEGKSWCLLHSYMDDVTPELPILAIRESFSVINSKGENTCTCIKQENTTSLRRGCTGHIGVISLTERTGNPSSLILNDEFTLTYEINLYEVNAKKTSQLPIQAISTSEIPGRTMPKDFGLLFNSQKGNDVVLLVDSQEFTAHKLILSARSSVFATMFEIEMKESQENSVKIEDIDADTFKELLRFIYTDEVQNIESYAYELLRAAHKYDLSRLKSMCEIQLCYNLDNENCTTIFSAADIYNCNGLKKQAFEFIVNNATVVTKTKGFEVMTKSHPHLTVEVAQALAAKSHSE